MGSTRMSSNLIKSYLIDLIKQVIAITVLFT